MWIDLKLNRDHALGERLKKSKLVVSQLGKKVNKPFLVGIVRKETMKLQ